jgi:hypothetical protein
MPWDNSPKTSILRAALKFACAAGLLGASCKQAPEQANAAVEPPTRGGGAHAELDRLDTRTPVPLLPMMANHQRQNMRDHLVAVQQILRASSRGDFVEVEKAASRIGYSEQMGRMCQHMGAAAPGFTEQALAFHRTADTIAAAANAKDADAVLHALDATLQACTHCHAAFRQQVVDEATWTKLTAEPPATDHSAPH